MAIWNIKKGRYLTNNDTLFEAVICANAGPQVYIPGGNLNGGTDAFGRVRVSEPYTLFDSSFRYSDSERRWNTRTSGSGSITYVPESGCLDIMVGSTSGDEVIRQTDRVFGYQPGKSLLIMNTFTFAEPKTNLRQRVGYFLKKNGIFLERDGEDIYIVKRSNSTGSIVETRIPQSQWNVNKLNGSGADGITLDLTKSHIFWMDIEWLGVGSVRTGFVINGQFIVCHIFHHANTITGTYMTTASLSCRYEITNTGATSGSSTMKQICSTVLSEGGYTQEGLSRSVSNPLTGRTLPKNQQDFPMVSIRLRSNRTDAVVVPRATTLYGFQGTPYKYKIIKGATITGGTWEIEDSASSVEYNLTADSALGGITLYEGIFKGQANFEPLNFRHYFDHSLQLTRDIIDSDSAGDTFTIVLRCTSNNDKAIAALNWQERLG